MTTHHLSIYKYNGFGSPIFRNIQLQDEQEFLRAQQLCKNDKNMAGPWKWSFIPIRTDQLSDLLLPSSIHGALRAQEFALDYSENLLAVVLLITLIWDVVTLPIRLVTYLPRLCYNAYAQRMEHPLFPYLREKGFAELVDIAPRVTYQAGNGDANMYIHKKEPQRVDIHLYTQRDINGEGRVVDRAVDLYRLYLAGEEVPFVPTHKSSMERAGLVPGVQVIPENAAINLGPFQIPVFEPRN